MYKCAQDCMAYDCEKGEKKSTFYDGESRDMQIDILFKQETNACSFQNSLMNFKFAHPSFGLKINIDRELKEEYLSKRILHVDYDGADNDKSPALSLADIRHILSSNGDSTSYDPIKSLMSLENISILLGLKFHWCHLVSRQVK